MSMALVIAYLDPVIWIYLLLARGGFWRMENDATADAPALAEWPSVTLFIPARNDANMLERTLPTLLANDYPGPLAVVMVDDRSEDATASVAENIAARLGKKDLLDVVSANTVPAGWKGKVWAMQNGLDHIARAHAAPRYVLFTDADIAYDAGALTQLVARAEADDSVLASRMVRLRCSSPAERFLIPAFVYFFRMLYPFRWVNDPKNKMAAAAGGCMLVRYDVLQKAGGMHSIRNALIDDCALGRLLKKQGRVSLELTCKMHSLRAYPAISDIHAMVARSAYDQLGYSPWKLAAAILGLAITYIAPVWLTLFASGVARYGGIMSWILMTLSFLPMLRFYSRTPLLGLTLPAVAIAYMLFTLDSAWQHWHGRGGMWKGRIQATDPQPT